MKNSFNKYLTVNPYEIIQAHTSPLLYHKPLYAKLKNTNAAKISQSTFPDALLGAGHRLQFTPYI